MRNVTLGVIFSILGFCINLIKVVPSELYELYDREKVPELCMYVCMYSVYLYFGHKTLSTHNHKHTNRQKRNFITLWNLTFFRTHFYTELQVHNSIRAIAFCCCTKAIRTITLEDIFSELYETSQT